MFMQCSLVHSSYIFTTHGMMGIQYLVVVISLQDMCVALSNLLILMLSSFTVESNINLVKV